MPLRRHQHGRKLGTAGRRSGRLLRVRRLPPRLPHRRPVPRPPRPRPGLGGQVLAEREAHRWRERASRSTTGAAATEWAWTRGSAACACGPAGRRSSCCIRRSEPCETRPLRSPSLASHPHVGLAVHRCGECVAVCPAEGDRDVERGILAHQAAATRPARERAHPGLPPLHGHRRRGHAGLRDGAATAGRRETTCASWTSSRCPSRAAKPASATCATATR